jgi:hypothetical protein
MGAAVASSSLTKSPSSLEFGLFKLLGIHYSLVTLRKNMILSCLVFYLMAETKVLCNLTGSGSSMLTSITVKTFVITDKIPNFPASL